MNHSLFIEIAEDLRWTWEMDKHTPFRTYFTYLGLDWNIATCTVALPLAKREKYLQKLENWTHSAQVSRKETENVVGTLNHCTYVVTQGCSQLVSLY
jgi:hypothetical protein